MASGQQVTRRLRDRRGHRGAPGDFTAAPASSSSPPGETTKTVNVTAINDALDEAIETFNVGLTNPAATISDATGVGTIVDDD